MQVTTAETCGWDFMAEGVNKGQAVKLTGQLRDYAGGDDGVWRSVK